MLKHIHVNSVHRGYLKIPDHSRSRKAWRTVAVQLLSTSRLLAEVII